MDEDSIFSSYSGREEDLDSQSEYEVASEAGDALFASSRRSSGKRSRKSGGYVFVCTYVCMCMCVYVYKCIYICVCVFRFMTCDLNHTV